MTPWRVLIPDPRDEDGRLIPGIAIAVDGRDDTVAVIVGEEQVWVDRLKVYWDGMVNT